MTGPRLALIGYGAMGREVEYAARAQERQIVTIFDTDLEAYNRPIDSTTLAGIDVCIEFTTPDAVLRNIRACADSGVNLVVGTTGWFEELEEARRIIADSGIGMIYASNFSIGIHLFRRIVAFAGTLLNRHPQYDVAVHEQHHRMKKDAPSGTAYTIAAELLAALDRKTRLAVDRPAERIDSEELHVSSTRIGSVPGTHRVTFDSLADTIELIHTARNRQALAEGALLAASWIQGRKGLFTIEDMLNDFETV
jgi:4-hydroxy-tetrahydrodipicolinate reductase